VGDPRIGGGNVAVVTIRPVDDMRIGRLLRALRRRRPLTQEQLGVLGGVSQSLVSLIERGHLATVSTRVVRNVFGVLDARFEGLVTWRGGATDRLLDERHPRSSVPSPTASPRTAGRSMSR
jgi:transcriptional regulator with XRE-family HTH domain